ncbi:hypothetical protein MRB53_023773 [Persea americana]|uniref:Uncharacterized protein n=1 Tax=Persea americana TaxID=3435 RepID=A0ACC2LAI4_PERAE|nr:hypothetical protein MRB53_023773 [Persea americana]
MGKPCRFVLPTSEFKFQGQTKDIFLRWGKFFFNQKESYHHFNQGLAMTMIVHQLGKLVGRVKSKLRVMKTKKVYDKIDKSESMRVEIKSRKAQKLIAETLKIADKISDSPRHKSSLL